MANTPSLISRFVAVCAPAAVDSVVHGDELEWVALVAAVFVDGVDVRRHSDLTARTGGCLGTRLVCDVPDLDRRARWRRARPADPTQRADDQRPYYQGQHTHTATDVTNDSHGSPLSNGREAAATPTITETAVTFVHHGQLTRRTIHFRVVAVKYSFRVRNGTDVLTRRPGTGASQRNAATTSSATQCRLSRYASNDPSSASGRVTLVQVTPSSPS